MYLQFYNFLLFSMQMTTHHDQIKKIYYAQQFSVLTLAKALFNKEMGKKHLSLQQYGCPQA